MVHHTGSQLHKHHADAAQQVQQHIRARGAQATHVHDALCDVSGVDLEGACVVVDRVLALRC